MRGYRVGVDFQAMIQYDYFERYASRAYVVPFCLGLCLNSEDAGHSRKEQSHDND